MKAIIPIAGVGIALRSETYTQPKPLIPVAGKPIIAFIIDQLRGGGVDDFVFIIGHQGDKIIDYVEKNYPQLKKSFVFQSYRQGLGHALWLAQDEIDKDEALVIALGDTIFDMDLKSFLEAEESCVATKTVTDPGNFGIVQLNDDNYVTDAIEKPLIPKSNVALVGLYKFKIAKPLFDALEYIVSNEIQSHQAYQLTDAIMHMVQNGERIASQMVKMWYDCGKTDMLLATNALLLDRYGYYKNARYDFNNSIIIPPVSIGEDCDISDAIIGPNVSIGEKSTIKNAIIEDTIVGNGAVIREILLKHSVVGNETIIQGNRHELNIGDDAKISLT